MNNNFWGPFFLSLHDLFGALTPALFGSAIGQAWSRGLTWRQRLVQWLTGIFVSYYVTLGLAEVLHFGPFVAQAVGFTIAMMAFEVAPKLIGGISATAAKIPDYVGDIVARWSGVAPRKGPEE